MNTHMNTSEKTKKIAVLGTLGAMAYVVMVFVRFSFVPGIPGIKYDPKDVIIAIGGFLYGPLSALGLSVAVGFLELVTVSTSGPIGFVMNVFSSCVFTGSAALIYKFKRGIVGAAMGLATGWLLAAALMMPMNLWLTPIHLPYLSRETVKGMLLPTVFPFNLLKGGINASITMLLYKPVSRALSAMGMRKKNPDTPPKAAGKIGTEFYREIAAVAAVLVLGVCVAAVIIWGA